MKTRYTDGSWISCRGKATNWFSSDGWDSDHEHNHFSSDRRAIAHYKSVMKEWEKEGKIVLERTETKTIIADEKTSFSDSQWVRIFCIEGSEAVVSWVHESWSRRHRLTFETLRDAETLYKDIIETWKVDDGGCPKEEVVAVTEPVKTFWMIVLLGAKESHSSQRHYSIDDAITEAERLTRKTGKAFGILKLANVCSPHVPSVIWTGVKD